MAKVPVKIVQIKDIHGTKKISIMLDVAYYIDTSENPDTKVRKFRDLYFELIERAKKIRRESMKKKTKSKKSRRHISTKDTWKMCNLLSEFNDKIENEFLITNYKEAYSRDFGMSMRSIRAFLDFGKYFSEDEVVDAVPYSIYMEIPFVINSLRERGLLDQEKQWLLKMSKEGNMPKRDEYRQHLKRVLEKQ